MQPTFAFSVLALLVAQVSASTPASLFSRQSSSGGLGLSSIPAACQTPCGPIESTINTCQDLSCLCNASVAQQIAACANCLVAVGGTSSDSLQGQEQSIVDQYTNACDTSGEPISSIQLSSVAPSSGSGSSTGSASGSATPSAASSPSTTGAAAASTSSSAAIRTQVGAGAGAALFAGLAALFVSA